MPESEALRSRERILIFIPGDQGAFNVLYRIADGRHQRAYVHGPCVAVVPAGREHGLSCQRQSDLIVVALDPRFFAEKARDALGCVPHLVERFAAVDPFIREVGNTLRSEFRLSRTPSAAYLESMAGVLAIHLAGHYWRSEAPRAPNAGLAAHKLNRVLALIQARIAEPIHVRELGAEAHLSLYHFARLFKQATGQPPYAYITRQRMEHAKSLLRNSSLSLVEVAASVGYQSQAHFTGVFHKYIGVTPRAFRVNAQAARPGH